LTIRRGKKKKNASATFFVFQKGGKKGGNDRHTKKPEFHLTHTKKKNEKRRKNTKT